MGGGKGGCLAVCVCSGWVGIISLFVCTSVCTYVLAYARPTQYMHHTHKRIQTQTQHQVYRMDASSIGCSLAEAAESPSYEQYLTEAHNTPNSLHVVYINTSLRTKAVADQLVPTITCTSSNVVSTVLTAFAQVFVCVFVCVCLFVCVSFSLSLCVCVYVCMCVCFGMSGCVCGCVRESE